MLFLLLIVFQEAFHQPFGECLTIGIHHQPTLIERILDITQLHKDGSGSGMGKYVSVTPACCVVKAPVGVMLIIF